MTLFDQISEDIKAAMKARDKVRLETLRNIKKVFLEAKTAPGANDTLEDADALKILQKLAKQGRETAQTYIDNNRQDLADEELAQAKVIEEYLPSLRTDCLSGTMCRRPDWPTIRAGSRTTRSTRNGAIASVLAKTRA